MLTCIPTLPHLPSPPPHRQSLKSLFPHNKTHKQSLFPFNFLYTYTHNSSLSLSLSRLFHLYSSHPSKNICESWSINAVLKFSLEWLILSLQLANNKRKREGVFLSFSLQSFLWNVFRLHILHPRGRRSRVGERKIGKDRFFLTQIHSAPPNFSSRKKIITFFRSKILILFSW